MTRFRWRSAQTHRAAKVTTLEPCIGLVFVLTLTQLTVVPEHDLSVAGLGRVFLVFGVLWYMHGGYAWLTNHVAPVRASQRLFLLAGMAWLQLVALVAIVATALAVEQRRTLAPVIRAVA